MKNFLENFMLHNYIDVFTGLSFLIGLFLWGPKAGVFMVFLVLHIFVVREGDEREKNLLFKAYAYSFNFLIGSMGIFAICCPEIITPFFIFGWGILLRGIVGIMVFLRN